MAAIDLGAGRKTKADKIDPKAGIIFNYKIGDSINKGVVLAELYSDSKKELTQQKGELNLQKNF